MSLDPNPTAEKKKKNTLKESMKRVDIHLLGPFKRDPPGHQLQESIELDKMFICTLCVGPTFIHVDHSDSIGWEKRIGSHLDIYHLILNSPNCISNPDQKRAGPSSRVPITVL